MTTGSILAVLGQNSRVLTERRDVRDASETCAPTRRILFVEDERSIRDLVGQRLQLEGYQCVSVADGQEGLDLAMTQPFDLVLLDLMLPTVDGVTICRTIRQSGSGNRDVPILMLTARRAESDKVLGFESGADDYLTKPFGIYELMARIGALMRRARKSEPVTSDADRPRVAVHGVELDPAKRTLHVRGTEVALTPHEFDLLYQLASSPGVVLTRKRLLDEVWRGQAFVTERSVDTLVRHLRCKIEEDASSPRLILTVWGYGYKFADQ